MSCRSTMLQVCTSIRIDISSYRHMNKILIFEENSLVPIKLTNYWKKNRKMFVLIICPSKTIASVVKYHSFFFNGGCELRYSEIFFAIYKCNYKNYKYYNLNVIYSYRLKYIYIFMVDHRSTSLPECGPTEHKAPEPCSTYL